MRTMRRLLVLLVALVALTGCQNWGPNDPARMSDNPELQMLRNSRRGGLRTRCASCHGADAGSLMSRPAAPELERR